MLAFQRIYSTLRLEIRKRLLKKIERSTQRLVMLATFDVIGSLISSALKLAIAVDWGAESKF